MAWSVSDSASRMEPRAARDSSKSQRDSAHDCWVIHAAPQWSQEHLELSAEQVQPLLADRCVVCHGCYDAPCQLKLGSSAGIERGLSKAKVYDGERLLASKPTRLHIDAQTAAEWRKLGFAPVLNERAQTEQANLQASVLMRSLMLKQAQPLPTSPVLPESFDFALDRDQQCPTIEEYDSFAAQYPLWGMPYGLPGLTDAELAPIERWVKMGSPLPPAPALGRGEARLVAEWEQFLNQESFKSQLVSRYLYEHLFFKRYVFVWSIFFEKSSI